MKELVVLVHSPLVGTFTWSLVAQHLQAADFEVLIPTLNDSGKIPLPYWQQYATSVQRELASIPKERPLTFIGHSGAGPLLPILAQTALHPTKGYLFVDASLPHPGRSQLDEMTANNPELAQYFRQLLGSGGRFPNWSEEDLRETIPDKEARLRVIAELQPRALDFFEEIMPVADNWPDAPCSYLLFTQGYRPFLEHAQRAGWPNQTFDADHFHMMVDPLAVATALVELMKQMNEKS